MIEVKSNFMGGLNLDDSHYVLPQNTYPDALNVTRDALQGNNDNVITNIIGNQKVDFTYPSGTGKVIGAFPFTLRNTVIFFRYNSSNYHGIYEYDNTTRLITKILENLTDSGGIDILGFTENDKITSVNVYPRDEGDLLFFLDSLGRPTELDITQFKAGAYTPVTRAIINTAKKPPLSPPQAVYGNDTAVRSNYFKGRLCRFKSRWIYDSLEKSTWSPISAVPLPVDILSDASSNLITNNNVIRLTANTGDKNVKSIELAFSYVNKTNDWSDFESIDVVNKTDLIVTSTVEFVVSGGSTDTTITLLGTPIAGAIVTINLIQLPSTTVAIGSYTILTGNTLTDVATGIAASMVSTGIAVSPTSSGTQILFSYYNTTYSFGGVVVNTNTEAIDNIDFPYAFYNDSTYPSVDINESILLFDYVPDYAKAQEMANGNVLVYGGITEGYDKNTTKNCQITINTVSAGNGGSVGSLIAVLKGTENTITSQYGQWNFSGIPAVGTVIIVQARLKSTHALTTVGTYTTIAGDTTVSIPYSLSNSIINVYSTSTINVALDFATYEPVSGSTYSQVLVTPPTTTAASNSIATFLPSSQRQIARAYFDENGKTNGILYTDEVVFPAYNEDASHVPLLSYINYKINDIPPSWAYSMQFYMTKDNTQYLVWESLSVNKDETEYIYFDVTSLVTNATKKPTTTQVCSYTFKDGDRVKVWKDITTNTVLDYTYDSAIEGLVVNPTINSVAKTGTFLKIKSAAPFTAGIAATDNYVLFIYTPSQQSANATNQVYYEFGRQYDIIDPTLSTRRHSGEVTDQTVGSIPAEYNFYEGDSYFRSRTIATSDTGYATFNVFDRNFVDFYISAVNSIDGRANIIDINARKQYYSTLLRFGQAYQADTNINGLNRFYPNDFDEYDYNYGDIIRIKVRDRFLKIFQKLKIGIVPLYSQITKDAGGNQTLVVSDKLLNPIQYRIGNFGLSAPESLASYHYADYGCDTSKGIIWRDSNDGTIPISQLYKVDSWAIVELPLRTGNKKIYGAFYPTANQYIMALEESICTPLVIPSFTLPNATLNVAYSEQVAITGSDPITIYNETKPSWMAISAANGYITFSGTPTATGSALTVSFTAKNNCASAVVISKTINVADAACVAVSLAGTPSMPDAYVGTPYSYDFYVAGTAPFTAGIPSEAWMSATVTGNKITLSGTPVTNGSVTVSVTITNACGSVPFSDPLVINPGGARFTATTFVSGNELDDVEIANLAGDPGVTVTITLDTLTNSNGGTLKVNGSAATLSETWNVVLNGSGIGSLDVAIYGVANPGTAILGHFTITGVSSGSIGTPDTYQISKAF